MIVAVTYASPSNTWRGSPEHPEKKARRRKVETGWCTTGGSMLLGDWGPCQ